ncbi:chemotaxis protein CheD [Candidatus Magnetominusculus dajiuhuensis]|uniref:chemotaxis protein CheD n=1 Tax=Candidatus Magnetominusculus dajiuhuensis TaxID=3137712 RepID=UPI003B433394
MKFKEMGLPLVFLKPGEVYITGKPALVKTVLGSCVSITMFEPMRRTAAICHGMLPDCVGEGCGECPEKLKYVTCSIKYILNKMRDRGVNARDIEVKAFGGGDVLTYKNYDAKATVGRQNIDAALEILGALGLKPKTSDLGGDRGRKIFFNTQTGEVLLRKLRKTAVECGRVT